MKFVCSLVVVENLTKSRYLYETLLGQQVSGDYGENISFGAFALHEKNHFRTLISNPHIQKGAHNFELYFEDDNIEEVYIKLKQHGIEFVHNIVEQPWQQRVFRFYDYDQNIVEIGETMAHVAYRLYAEGYGMEDICKITYLNSKTVIESINKYAT